MKTTTVVPPSMPIVIRPSGVWNSRSPFNDFLRQHRALNRSFHGLTLAIYRLQDDAKKLPIPSSGHSLYRFLGVRKAGAQAGASWTSYRLSFPMVAPGVRPKPSVDEFIDDLRDALYLVREAIVAACSSLFEVFVQCWTLNFLLAKLESRANWTRDETKLAKRFSPVHGKRILPSILDIVKAIPDLGNKLGALPHLKTDPATGNTVISPLSLELTALRAIKFWRDYRNQVVHRSKVISGWFYRGNNAFWEEFRQPYKSYMGPLKVGTRLQIYDDIVRATMTTHYEAVWVMNEWLKQVSGERRGHPFAPSPEPVPWPLLQSEPPSPPLLISGDHPASYQWVTQGHP